jgi:hypothetical protein
MKKSGLFMMLLCLVALMACSHQQDPKDAAAKSKQTAEPKYIYQDKASGFAIGETAGWKKDKKLSSENLPLVLTNGKLKAVISSASGKHSFEEIKKDLKAGSGQIKVLEERPDYLSFKSLNKESIETEAYLKKAADKNYVILFMMSANSSEENQKKIKGLLSNLSIH